MNRWMRRSWIVAAVMACAGGAVWAQNAPPATGNSPSAMSEMHGHMKAHMREHMAARHAKHLANLKSKLHLEAQQEPAWKTFADTMQTPPAHGPAMDRAALAKMSSPERADQMLAWHNQHGADMKQRADALKVFYGQLSADQKKTFDAESARFMASHEGHHKPMH